MSRTEIIHIIYIKYLTFRNLRNTRSYILDELINTLKFLNFRIFVFGIFIFRYRSITAIILTNKLTSKHAHIAMWEIKDTPVFSIEIFAAGICLHYLLTTSCPFRAQINRPSATPSRNFHSSANFIRRFDDSGAASKSCDSLTRSRRTQRAMLH